MEPQLYPPSVTPWSGFSNRTLQESVAAGVMAGEAAAGWLEGPNELDKTEVPGIDFPEVVVAFEVFQ